MFIINHINSFHSSFALLLTNPLGACYSCHAMTIPPAVWVDRWGLTAEELLPITRPEHDTPLHAVLPSKPQNNPEEG